MKRNTRYTKKQRQQLCQLAFISGLTFYTHSSFSHGFTEIPKARQSICQSQGGYWWPEDGSGIQNLACRQAFLQTGYVQFVQEHEISVNVPNYQSIAAVQAAVADGKLCSAGSEEKAGLNIASPHWQKTTVTPDDNGKILVRFNAQTPHNPSFWQFYLSDPSFNSDTDVLTWQDLSLIDSADNTAFYVAEDGNRYYDFQVQIPEGRVGQALLYVRWQRNDIVGEGFYNCSDIIIERQTTEPDNWHSIAYYLTNGQSANVGDSVHLRLFDPNGNEIINETLLVTETNATNWAADLAQQVTPLYSTQIAIGVTNGQGDVVFNATDLLINQVYATNPNNTYQLGIIPKPANRAPVIVQPGQISLQEGKTTTVHVHAYDEDQDPLTFQWSFDGPLTLQSQNSDVQLTALQVESDTLATVSVSVSDGELSSSRQFQVLVTNQPNDPDAQEWDASKTYVKDDKVTYQNALYTAKWWNKNERPDQSNAWQQQLQNSDQWLPSKAYNAGEEVSFEGNRYKAKWWTRGDAPNQSSAWQIL